MHDLRVNYVLSLNKRRTTSHGLSFFSYVSAKLQNVLPDFIRTTVFTGFKRESRAAFCTAAFFLNEYISKNCVFSYVPVYVMYFSCKCNASKILALVVILKFEIK